MGKNTAEEKLPLLRARGLSVSYDGYPAVRGVNIDIWPGKITGLIGESGSGKSTIGAAAMGLLPAKAHCTADEFTLAGRDVLSLNKTEWLSLRGSTISMVFQEPLSALDPTMTIGAHVALALRNHATVPESEIDAEVLRLLELVSLPEPERRSKQYPHQLSGGQLQRVVIAMALAGRPKVIIADEPTTALDVTVQAEILKVFREIASKSGIGILFISHDLGVIANVADSVTVLLHGTVVQSGPTHEVLHGQQHPYTRALLAALPGSVPPRHRLGKVGASLLEG